MERVKIDEETILELKNIYNRILDDTVSLIDNYNLKTPVEIFSLFYYIVETYLDKKNDAFPTSLSALERDDISGIIVLVDGGVCRHRSEMLNDIYRRKNILSVPIGGYVENLLKFNYRSRGNEGLKNMAYESMIRQRLNEGAKLEDFKPGLNRHKMTYGIDEERKKELQMHPRMGNHEIIMVGSDKKNYFDLMNGKSYSCFYSSDDLDILSSSSGVYFFYYHNDWRKILLLRKAAKKDTNFLDYDEKWNIINRLECVDEKENEKNIRGLIERFKHDHTLIEEYLNDNSNNIETIRETAKVLKKELIS